MDISQQVLRCLAWHDTGSSEPRPRKADARLRQGTAACRGGYLHAVATERRQPSWLIPAFIALVAVGLVFVIVGIANQVWFAVVLGTVGVLGNTLGLWAQLLTRRSQAARRGD